MRYKKTFSGTTQRFSAVSDYLKGEDRLSALLPHAEHLGTLQKACEHLAPDLFAECSVLGLNKGQLTVSVPNQSRAARLRQKLPLLQKELQHAGWPVDKIRLKVKLSGFVPATAPVFMKAPLPETALTELNRLQDALKASGSDDELMKALETLVKRHQG